jgi:uncharacterized protein
MSGVIVDAHTHAFPPDFIAARERIAEVEPAFAEIYSNPHARMAEVDQVLGAEASAGVDLVAIAGFAWRDPGRCRDHNDYLMQAANASGGRALAFCNLPLNDGRAAELEALRCVRGRAAGFGELRPESQGTALTSPDCATLLTWICEAHDLPILIHTTEPVGHRYPGKEGGGLRDLYEFVSAHEHVRLIAAHWGGGLPFYAHMPEVKAALANVWVDTAATTLLYDASIYRSVIDLIGADHLLFGSDYPLLSPQGQIAAIERAPLTEDERRAVLGNNAAQLLHCEPCGIEQ